MGGPVTVLPVRTFIDTLRNVQESRLLTTSAVATVQTGQTMLRAGRTDHVGCVVEPVGRTVLETSIVARCHEVVRTALETGGV